MTLFVHVDDDGRRISEEVAQAAAIYSAQAAARHDFPLAQ
jgi:hypothetical protein